MTEVGRAQDGWNGMVGGGRKNEEAGRKGA